MFQCMINVIKRVLVLLCVIYTVDAKELFFIVFSNI
jgi:hypothetical protein